MQKAPEFLVHVCDRRRATVGPAADTDAREQAHKERETAPAPIRRDPLSAWRPPRVPRSPTKQPVTSRHPVVRCALPLFVIVLPIYPGPQSWQCIASPTLYYIPFSSTDY